MKNRALINRHIQFGGTWAVKQVLTSIPVVGYGFKMFFLGADVLKVVQEVLGEELEPVPLAVGAGYYPALFVLPRAA